MQPVNPAMVPGIFDPVQALPLTAAPGKPLKRRTAERSTSAVIDHIRSFTNDVKTQLADGDWHLIATSECCGRHSISCNMFRVLENLHCIESRRRVRTKGKGWEFRRLAGLQTITITAIAAEKSRDQKERKKPPTPPPVPQTPTSSGLPAAEPPAPNPDPQLLAGLPVQQFLLLGLNEHNRIISTVGDPFPSAADAEAYLLTATTTGCAAFMIVAMIEVLRPTMTFTRSKTV